MLTIRLEATGTILPVSGLEAPTDLLSVLEVICDELEECGCVRFLVGGFGQEAWPVDVRTDLLTVVEQLPQVVDALTKEAAQFELDFYEQGLQRRLNFERTGADTTITCTSATEWDPSPDQEHMSIDSLVDIMRSLRSAFVDLAGRRCPEVAQNDLFSQWVTATRI